MTHILALDIATTTGFARGKVGAIPIASSICFAAHAGASNNAVFSRAITWFAMFLKDLPRCPDILVIEAMLPPDAMKGETSRAVRDRLAGLHGIMRGIAYARSIYRIDAVTVGDIRGHFLGARGLRRDEAKRAVVERCHALGWKCANDNEGDALALWSYACAQVDPTTALMVSPLFNRGLRITRQSGVKR